MPKKPKRRKFTKPKELGDALRAYTRKDHPIKRGGASVPCPKCGAPSSVIRTMRGERLRTSRRKPTFVLRHRRCVSPAHHKFETEEHTR